MKGSDDAPKVYLGLGNPAEIAEFPEFYVCSRDVRQNNTMQVDWFGKPFSEILLYATVLAGSLRRRVWLYF